MANRETTYYSLLSSENLRHIEQMADTMDERSFVTLGFDNKWFCHLWIGGNNEAFLEHISHQTDLAKLDMILGEQLKLYARKKGEGYEQDKCDFYGAYKARKDWLNHTIFICRIEYKKTQNEVFNEVIKWCIDWQKEWLETFNPYSPTERKEMIKDLKIPLWEKLSEGEPPEQTEKPKPELNEALISFSSTEIIESLHNELKGYFQGKEDELKKALQGEHLQELLLFPHNQNKFVEVFKRLKYNGFLLNTPKEIKDWICSTFTYQYRKGNKKEVREFNTSTVHDILTKDKGEPTKTERICIVSWLPYKSHLARQREAEKESI